MKKPTLKDVADAAGISVAAVSMILAGKGKMSPAVSEKVRGLAMEMGYRRRTTGERQGGRKFKYVSILQHEDFPYLWNFSQPFVSYLEEETIRMGYYPLILHIPNNADSRTVFKEVTGARVGAVFAIHYADALLFDKLEEAGIPVIIINNGEYQKRFWSVLADEVQGASEATMHLVEMGHRIIAYADYERPAFPILVNDRYFGYRKALAESGLAYDEALRISVPLEDLAMLQRRLEDLLRRPEPPTAFAVHDDYFGAYLIEALRRIGKQVPRDISIIATGGDVLDYEVPFIPKINTMQIDRRLMVSMAWSLLESRIHSRPDSVQVLKTKMPYVDRGSARFDMD